MLACTRQPLKGALARRCRCTSIPWLQVRSARIHSDSISRLQQREQYITSLQKRIRILGLSNSVLRQGLKQRDERISALRQELKRRDEEAVASDEIFRKEMQAATWRAYAKDLIENEAVKVERHGTCKNEPVREQLAKDAELSWLRA